MKNIEMWYHFIGNHICETKPYKSGIAAALQLIYSWSNKDHSDYHRLSCFYVQRLYIRHTYMSISLSSFSPSISLSLYIYTYISVTTSTHYTLPSDLIKLNHLFVINIWWNDLFELVCFANMSWFYFLSFTHFFRIIKGMRSSTTITSHIICAKTSSYGISAAGLLLASKSFCLRLIAWCVNWIVNSQGLWTSEVIAWYKRYNQVDYKNGWPQHLVWF